MKVKKITTLIATTLAMHSGLQAQWRNEVKEPAEVQREGSGESLSEKITVTESNSKYLPVKSFFRQNANKFLIDSSRYPAGIYKHYKQAESEAANDTAMNFALAIPSYRELVELGEKDREKNKEILLKAYAYLGGYEANITKRYLQSLNWFEKYLDLDKENREVRGYIVLLKKWIVEKK